MRDFLKVSALSAILSVPAVAAYNQAWSSPSQVPSAKLYQDRLPESGAATVPLAAASAATPAPARTGLGKGDRIEAAGPCAGQTWPYIAPACLTGEDSAKAKRVRVITVETRVGPNTSLLSRVPQTDVASR